MLPIDERFETYKMVICIMRVGSTKVISLSSGNFDIKLTIFRHAIQGIEIRNIDLKTIVDNIHNKKITIYLYIIMLPNMRWSIP